MGQARSRHDPGWPAVARQIDDGVAISFGDHVAAFRSTDVSLTPSGDAALCLALLAAMHGGRRLSVPDGLSARMARDLPAIQGIESTFFGVTPVEVDAPTVPATPLGTGVGCFFSGGVDSFFTARRRPDIDTLVFVHGFDLQLDQEHLRRQAAAAARDAAARMGKRLVEVTTDMRSIPVVSRNWEAYSGPAMATVAQLLAGDLAQVYVPASYQYAVLFPWGSHPMLDHLWGGDRVELVHDGAEATRFDKVGAVADDPVAQQHLRVCWENRDGHYNCGQCEKCTRTMIALRAHGALERFTPFAESLDLRRVRFGEVRGHAQATFARETLRRLDETGADPELADALRWGLRIGPRRAAVHWAAVAAKARLTALARR